ncbi:MAG: hypothetical protein AVDCRST_MAG49-4711 [uncultured Thermomicrobiales bacterium]|uniref:Helix-turn-helix domain-containing protein n=1 Tax=uncultured Thermomicrobiales bacterium TaxID=1645740 RepID=A0A6J4VN73_9BACT|nr:MAG: hypothetical protein AVDCRST_MAG49-4711 [uncultured Thermomicrobiales bacterium]
MSGVPPAVDSDLLTIPEAAEVLKVSAVTVSRYLKQGRLPAFRVGPRAVRIRRADLDRVLLPTTPGDPPPGPVASGPVGGNGAVGRGAAAVAGGLPLAPGAAPVPPPDLTAYAARPDVREGQRSAIVEARALRERILARRRGVALSSSGVEAEKGRDKRGKKG